MEENCTYPHRLIMSVMMNPEHANPYGNVHGGVIMKFIDEAAGVCAIRHARKNAVTASIDQLDILTPVYVGELVTAKACINMVGRTSMEVGVRVEAENLRTGAIRHTATAYLTFVSLGEDGRPSPVSPLPLKTDEDKRRNREAQERRKQRLEEKNRKKAARAQG